MFFRNEVINFIKTKTIVIKEDKYIRHNLGLKLIKVPPLYIKNYKLNFPINTIILKWVKVKKKTLKTF